jgi:hypothetical protein
VDDLQPAAEEIKPRRKSTKRRPKSLPATASTVSSSSKAYSVWMPTSEVEYSDESEEGDQSSEDSTLSPPDSPPSQRPQAHRRVSSVPSIELPTIPRSRKTSQPTTPTADLTESRQSRELSASAPPKIRKKQRGPSTEDKVEEEIDEPPPPPPHRSPSPATPVTLKGSKTPSFTPTLSALRTKRRSSSPLKHEYEPSTCTEESSSESEEEVVSEEDVDEADEASLTSDSSEDELDDDVPMPLMPIGYIGPRGYTSKQRQGRGRRHEEIPQGLATWLNLHLAQWNNHSLSICIQHALPNCPTGQWQSYQGSRIHLRLV